MPLTDSIPEVAQAVQTLLQNDVGLALKDVYYGDEDAIPRVPAAAVAVALKTRTPYQSQENFRVNFSIVVDVFHARYASKQVTRLECDIFAEQVEDVLHSDRTLGGLVVYSYVASMEPGTLRRQKSLMVATRITLDIMSTKRLI